jgi:hypothetical protein
MEGYDCLFEEGGQPGRNRLPFLKVKKVFIYFHDSIIMKSYEGIMNGI